MPTPNKLHWRDIRLFNNAGIAFPVCYAGAENLDTDKSGLPTTPDIDKVTCAHCLREAAKAYPWMTRRKESA